MSAQRTLDSADVTFVTLYARQESIRTIPLQDLQYALVQSTILLSA
jgi:hypothetical protein